MRSSEELARKQNELSFLQLKLVDRELDLAEQWADLSAFEGLYLRRVGSLYLKLDEWNARIAELMAGRQRTAESQAPVIPARAGSADSAAPVLGEAAKAEKVTRSLELKGLFREVLRRIHPDIATDNANRLQRANLMVEASAAYERGDGEPLKQILTEYGSDLEHVPATELGIARQIKQVERRLAQIELESAALFDSEIAKLKVKAEVAEKAEGRDLLDEMATDLLRRVNAARNSFEVR